MAGIFQSLARSNVIRRSVLYNGPRAAVDINDGFGGNLTMEDNLMFAWSRETGGHAAFNAWVRSPSHLLNIGCVWFCFTYSCPCVVSRRIASPT
eukprot:COSAG01_NODE_1532_length_10007_cov_4.889842_2_plen_94_part_00